MFCEWFLCFEWVVRDAVRTLKEYPLRGATAIAIVVGCLVWMFVHTHNSLTASPSRPVEHTSLNKKMKRENKLLEWKLNK